MCLILLLDCWLLELLDSDGLGHDFMSRLAELSEETLPCLLDVLDFDLSEVVEAGQNLIKLLGPHEA
jgi:hypothetical protein